MTTANGIKDQINRLVECLVGIGLADDQNPSFVRQLSGKQFEVTFPKSHYVTAALKDRSYEDIYIQLNTERAFTIKLPDGALLLLRYLFNDDRGLDAIVSASILRLTLKNSRTTQSYILRT